MQMQTTSSQLLRQSAALSALNAAEASARRTAQAARFRAAFHARQTAALERRALEERNNFAAVRTGTDYERFVAALLTTDGFTVMRVGGSGDCGADLLVSLPSGTAVVQCKYYSFPVGYDAVKEAYAAKALYKATAAFVCTNATYTRQARRTAAQLGIQLTTHATLSAALGRETSALNQR